MKKKLRNILIMVNALAVILFALAIIVPIERKTVKFSDVDISSYNGKWAVPKLGAVTNQRSAEIAFSLYNEKLYGISLFFYADGEVEDGEVLCTLQCDGEELETVVIPVKELFVLMRGASVNAREIIFQSRPDSPGRYTLILEGRNIDPDTRISLFGKHGTQHYASFETKENGKFRDILYIIETIKPEHPYIWAASLILALSLMITALIYMDGWEKRFESAE